MAERPQVRAVHETVVYAEDLDAAVDFYAGVLGLPLYSHNRVGATFKLEDGNVLLVFDPVRASTPGRSLPSHGTRGAGHVAFTVDKDDVDAFVAAFHEHGIAIEHDETWDWGTRSVYVRDPAGNVVELVDGTAWPDESRA